ncbi:MAG: efflux RND transporter periplasmic adaptor subunit [Syntrophobacteraceae bacterium]|nr:efflux RND transporter periplasmic adaptor subunit [Syntrophobacteraceae bacterium]
MRGRRPESISRGRLIAIWGIAAAILAFSAGCQEKHSFVPPPPPKVTVKQPIRRSVTIYRDFTGNTQAFNTVQLRARVEGYLEKVLFQDGAKVKQGQLLFQIQASTYENKLKQAEAEVLSQKANLEHAEREYARYTQLFKENAAAATDVSKWLFERDSAKAKLLSAQAQTELAKLDLSYTKVTAPFDGRIDRRLQDPGNLVGSGEKTVLAEINQINPIYVYFTISERDLLKFLEIQKAKSVEEQKTDWSLYMALADQQGFSFQGELDFGSITLDAKTGTLLLRGIFPNPEGRIWAGMYARIRAPVDTEKDSLLVPETAVGTDQLGRYVLVVNDKNLVERRGVEVSFTWNQMLVVEKGLTENEWIIVNGLSRAIPGREVNPSKEEGPESPSKPKDS